MKSYLASEESRAVWQHQPTLGGRGRDAGYMTNYQAIEEPWTIGVVVAWRTTHNLMENNNCFVTDLVILHLT